MQYLLLIYDAEKTWEAMPPAEANKLREEYQALNRDITASGHMKAAEALESARAATTVRVRDGKIAATDGPFAEAREQLGGFYLVEAKDLAEATQIAARIPSARLGAIEIRAIRKVGA
jgi:hypothetical protein